MIGLSMLSIFGLLGWLSDWVLSAPSMQTNPSRHTPYLAFIIATLLFRACQKMEVDGSELASPKIP